MTDVLVYWRDYTPDGIRPSAEERVWHWPTSSKVLGHLRSGDRVWFVTSGRNVGQEARQAGFLVAIGTVAEVVEDHGHDSGCRQGDGRYRISLDEPESFGFDPVLVDHLLRPEGRDASIPIGRFVSVPRRLNEQLVRKLRAAAGPELALRYLTGTRR